MFYNSSLTMSLFFLEKFIVQMQNADAVILCCDFDFLRFRHAVVTNYLQLDLKSDLKYYSIAKGFFHADF